MKTVKLTTMPDGGLLNQPYTSGKSISFSTCSEIRDGAAEMLTGLYYCREEVINNFAKFFSKRDGLDTDGSKTPLYNYEDMPKKKTSVAVHINIGNKDAAYIKSLDNEIKRSIKLLNHYERRNKWFLSEVYKADHDSRKSDLIYLFKSSKWWMTSTHTLSLYLLLIRLGEYELFDVIKKFTANPEVLSLFNKVRDLHDNHPERWNVLLDNRKKIYGERMQKEIFTFADAFTVKVDGIWTLCENRSCDKITKEKFAELCKEAGLEIPKDPKPSTRLQEVEREQEVERIGR